MARNAYELLQGRPKDENGRLEKELRCYDLLDRLNIEYHRIDHERTDHMRECEEIDAVLGAAICKNLFLCNRQQTNFYLLLISGDKALKTSELSRQLGVTRLSFARPEYMERFLDTEPGSASILGLMNDTENCVRLIVDKDILESEYIGCHPCINTASLRIRTQDMFGRLLEAMHHSMTVVNLSSEEK